MKAFTISAAVALLAALAQATPTPNQVNARVASTTPTFCGAAGACYTQTFPDNGAVKPISMYHNLSTAVYSIPPINRALDRIQTFYCSRNFF